MKIKRNNKQTAFGRKKTDDTNQIPRFFKNKMGQIFTGRGKNLPACSPTTTPAIVYLQQKNYHKIFSVFYITFTLPLNHPIYTLVLPHLFVSLDIVVIIRKIFFFVSGAKSATAVSDLFKGKKTCKKIF